MTYGRSASRSLRRCDYCCIRLPFVFYSKKDSIFQLFSQLVNKQCTSGSQQFSCVNPTRIVCRWEETCTSLIQVNSTENYGRRCLTPLSPHHYYLGLRRRNDGSLLLIGESVHVSRVQFWSCRSGSSCCTARHQGCWVVVRRTSGLLVYVRELRDARPRT